MSGATPDPVLKRDAVDVKLPSDGSENDSPSSLQDEQVFRFGESRKLGVTACVFLIINKMIGTGIFSTPSGVFAATGSVGVCLFLWIIGGIITFCGLSVFLEFGLAIPRSGGEKNYLERVYRRPKLLATCVLLAQMVLLGFSSGNSLAFGRYILFASGSDVADGWKARGIAVGCITFAVLLHSTFPKWGIRLFNVLGVFKVVILLFIVIAGFAALAGHRRIPNPHNFDNAFHLEKGPGYGGGGAYAYATALLRIIYSYKGWENANYVLGEVKNPRKTLLIAAPLAVASTAVLYVLANVAYFAAVTKEEIATSDVLIAGLFFRNIFGDSASARSLPAFIALSNLGNVLALFLHWLVTVIILLAPPAGPAYNFIVDLYTYPGAWINGAVCAGLLYLHFRKSENWSSPFHTYFPVIVLYLLANIFLAIVPFIPPEAGNNAEGYPYYVFPVVGVAVLIAGAVYWWLWTRVWPRIGGYRLEAERCVSEIDGSETVRYRKVYMGKHHGLVHQDGDGRLGRA
ncbi:hypothetical protein EPUS_07161 [Endocarpon pusillum Z07020]|uniref:High-affinity methionine permease n=1 Tax=Endocarpon pusillum (strain Z07020 / HMAS-L-300199) TaxID=1263415 RepID=U1HEW1_ENDPU|nr:uncharacterized protein EPUS_07161 [Endocarpon pusillum Z07020]ERF68600.1 hypothetical protein EPUS_07161 [Endocarpon pusillum Z07020]